MKLIVQGEETWCPVYTDWRHKGPPPLVWLTAAADHERRAETITGWARLVTAIVSLVLTVASGIGSLATWGLGNWSCTAQLLLISSAFWIVVCFQLSSYLRSRTLEHNERRRGLLQQIAGRTR